LVPPKDARHRTAAYNHIMTTPRMPHDDLAAALAARQELGPDYDAAFVEKVVERVEQTIDVRLNAHSRAQTQHEQQSAKDERKLSFTIACVSLGVSVPLTAIAARHADALGMLIVWIGLVMVNMANALRGRRH
jgi:hypothetical protein